MLVEKADDGAREVGVDVLLLVAAKETFGSNGVIVLQPEIPRAANLLIVLPLEIFAVIVALKAPGETAYHSSKDWAPPATRPMMALRVQINPGPLSVSPVTVPLPRPFLTRTIKQSLLLDVTNEIPMEAGVPVEVFVPSIANAADAVCEHRQRNNIIKAIGVFIKADMRNSP